MHRRSLIPSLAAVALACAFVPATALAQARPAEAVKSRLAGPGMIVIGNSAPEFGRFIDAELTKWGAVIKTAGIVAE